VNKVEKFILTKCNSKCSSHPQLGCLSELKLIIFEMSIIQLSTETQLNEKAKCYYE
jgi:hypothetical protein